MLPLDHLLAPALLRALGWTLLHSLWQGTGLGLGVALLLWLLRQQAAVVRYRLAAVALATLVGLAGATFGYYYQQAPAWVTPAAARLVSQPTYAALLHHPPAAQVLPGWRGLLLSASAYLEQHLAVGVGLWLLGFLLMLGRLLLALRYAGAPTSSSPGAAAPTREPGAGRLAASAGATGRRGREHAAGEAASFVAGAFAAGYRLLKARHSATLERGQWPASG